MNQEAIKDLLYRVADDALIIGHRNSEWTGLGPILEEDIAFSSMAQDEIGAAQAYYVLLHELFGEAPPNQIGFNRSEAEFRSCHLVEYPNEDYAFSLVRHALFDLSEMVRLKALTQSSFMPLAELAKKLSREEKYHELHARTWISQLGNATEESNSRLQAALNKAYPLALGIFEPTSFDKELESEGIQPSESTLQQEWEKEVSDLFTGAGLKIPTDVPAQSGYGGRSGSHSEFLAPLLKEMNAVFSLDTTAVW